MRIHLDQLEALVWISRLGSFRRAARRLNISQPAVSGRVRKLERQLDVVVLDRSQRRPRLTSRGTEIVRCAEQIMGMSDRLVASLKPRDTLVGRIRIGAADSFALCHLSRLLQQVALHHPAARVELDIDFSVNLDRRLRAAELDIAFLHAPVPSPEISIESLYEFELAWFASPQMRFPRRRVTPADLMGIPILTNPRQSHLHCTVVEWFASVGVVPERLNTCNSLPIIAKLTADGLGVSALPPMLLRSEMKAGVLRRLDSTPALPSHHLAVAYRTDPGLGNLANIVGLVRSVIRN